MRRETTPQQGPPGQDGDSFLLVLVLDRSGSMERCRADTVEGFKQFLHEQQQEKPGEAALTLVQFDATAGEPGCQVSYRATPIAEVDDLGTPENPYQPRGATPLLDAVGRTIVGTDDEARSYDHVLFMIQTDGLENASHEFGGEQVQPMVDARREQGWDFVFLGADIDAERVADSLAIPSDGTMAYSSSTQSRSAFRTLGARTSRYRQSGAPAPAGERLQEELTRVTQEEARAR